MAVAVCYAHWIVTGFRVFIDVVNHTDSFYSWLIKETALDFRRKGTVVCTETTFFLVAIAEGRVKNN
jgi:hypothetical protein